MILEHLWTCCTTPLSWKQPGGGGDPYSEMHLLPEALFSLPTDNVSMISIVGDHHGTGTDGW